MTKRITIPPGFENDVIGADVNGDGELDNGFAKFVKELGISGLNFQDTVNKALDIGRGAVLLDVQSSLTNNCAEITWTQAKPPTPLTWQPTETWSTRVGGMSTRLIGYGNNDAIQPFPADQLLDKIPNKLDLLLPLQIAVVHLEVYAPRIKVTKQPDGSIVGVLSGAIRAEDIEKSFMPAFARDFGYFINNNFDKPGLPPLVVTIEDMNQADTRKKCMIAADCCTTNPATCKVLPAEIGRYLTRFFPIHPDIEVFDGPRWHPVPDGKQNDALSIVVGFEAVPVERSPGCQDDAWCQEPALPAGLSDVGLNDLWAPRTSDVWAVGAGGTILHFDGIDWARIPNPTNSSLSSIWGSNYDDIWAAGAGGTLLRWCGVRWYEIPAGTSQEITSLSGSGKNDVWATVRTSMYNGEIFHFNGATWTKVKTLETAPLSVHSLDAKNVWAVGEGTEEGATMATAYHYDGMDWHPESLNAIIIRPFSAVWANAVDDVWAVGSLGNCRHSDGKTWSDINCNANEGLKGVWSAATNDVWIVGERGRIRRMDPRHPGTWVQSSTGTTSEELTSVFGVDARNVWITGGRGTLLHYQPVVP